MTEAGTPAAEAAVTRAGRRPATTARQWAVFALLAGGVVAADQATKAWVTANLELGESIEILGGWLGLWHVANTGALFGLFRDQAVVFAVLSVAVMALIVWYHGRVAAGGSAGSWVATVALGLLLGGAIGNFIDRVRLGYVTDFVDMGIPGGWRFYTWNVADAAITVSILLLLALAVLPPLRRGDGPG